MPRAIAPLTPTPRNKRRVERSVAVLRHPAMVYWRLRHTKLTWSGVRQAQQMGPALVLANHANILDPAMLVAAFKKPIHFLAADTAMEEPFEGRVSRFFGSIPKRKFALDMAAIRLLRQWAKIGSSIGLFPEGERSWNSEPLPFVPGIERLVRMAQLPVVTARILNAGRVWPRWAPRPRRGHVHIEFSTPRSFSRSDSDQTILEHITKGLHIDSHALADFTVQGTQLARGLENALYACPACGDLDRMQTRGDHIDCPRCNTQWRIDTSGILHGNGDSIPLHQAMREARVQLRSHPERKLDAPPLLEASNVHWSERAGTLRRDNGQGVLKLHPDRVVFEGRTRIEVKLDEIGTCSLDLQRKLLLRKDGQTYQAHIPTRSALVWAHWIEDLKTAAKPA